VEALQGLLQTGWPRRASIFWRKCARRRDQGASAGHAADAARRSIKVVPVRLIRTFLISGTNRRVARFSASTVWKRILRKTRIGLLLSRMHFVRGIPMSRDRRTVSPVIHVVAKEVLARFEDESSSQAFTFRTRSVKWRIRVGNAG
jgi:hypothetical protein